MILTIIKYGNKNFQHKDADYKDYGANDITAIFEADRIKLRSFSGRIIFDKDGYDFLNVTVRDESSGGSDESFANIIELKQRLITLGYPFAGGTSEVELSEIDGGTA